MFNFSKNNAYNIYENEVKFVKVEAETVEEALQKSGIKKPLKVEKVNLEKISFVEPSMLADDPIQDMNINDEETEAVEFIDEEERERDIEQDIANSNITLF